MPRTGQIKPREVIPDPIFANKVVEKLSNSIMISGKKSIAQSLVYQALDKIKIEDQDPLKVFLLAIEQIKPTMEVRPRRVGGAAYQVPLPVKPRRRESLAIRWLLQAAKKRSNSQYHTFADKLAAEILEASKGEGGAIAKKKEIERMAEANRAFAHFRW